MNNNHKESDGFFYQPHVIRWFLRIFYSICIVLVLLEFVVHRHTIVDIEKVPAFYALYGLIACVILALISSLIRKFLMRDEDYYTRDEEEVNPHD